MGSRFIYLAGVVLGLLLGGASPSASDMSNLEAKSIIFIYDGNTLPCDPPSPGQTLLPLGSGFVVGLEQERNDTGSGWRGWKFLVTAHHVIGSRTSIILRLNSKDGSRLICHTHPLSWSGPSQNVFQGERPEVDLILIHMPDIPDTDPTIFDYSLIMDDSMYRSLEVGEGTEIYTIGYLYGYSGHRQNYPVTKFGKVALITEEPWYKSPPPRNLNEQAYLVELQNTPGLSGAPIILKSPQFRVDNAGQFQFRKLNPFIMGVIKGLLLSPTGPQGVAAIEPGKHLREILRRVAEELQKSGHKIKFRN